MELKFFNIFQCFFIGKKYGENSSVFDETVFFDERIFDEVENEARDEDAQHSSSVSTAACPQLSPLPTSSSDEDISSDDNLSHTAVLDKNSPPTICDSSEEEATAPDEGKVYLQNNF